MVRPSHRCKRLVACERRGSSGSRQGNGEGELLQRFTRADENRRSVRGGRVSLNGSQRMAWLIDQGNDRDFAKGSCLAQQTRVNAVRSRSAKRQTAISCRSHVLSCARRILVDSHDNINSGNELGWRVRLVGIAARQHLKTCFSTTKRIGSTLIPPRLISNWSVTCYAILVSIS